jgi:maltoporin
VSRPARILYILVAAAVLAQASSASAQPDDHPFAAAPPSPAPPPPSQASASEAPKAKEVAVPAGHEGSFEFGSYGRVVAASDLRGGTGRGTNVVAFGPRIVDEGSYAELELRHEDKFSETVKSRIVATLALFPPFFHSIRSVRRIPCRRAVSFASRCRSSTASSRRVCS